MSNTSENLFHQLQQLRELFAEAAPTDPKVINNYAWIIVKAINSELHRLGSVESRRLLAEYLRLPAERPSQVHSAILSVAISVAKVYPEFHFASFVRMWDLHNLRPEDCKPVYSRDGKSFPALSEKTARALGKSLIIYPEDSPSLEQTPSGIEPLLRNYGLSVHAMLVTRIKDAAHKEGRKFRFVNLVSPEGIEVETLANVLVPSPLHPLSEGKRHYVNIGQLYNVVLRTKNGSQEMEEQGSSASKMHVIEYSVSAASLASQSPTSVFPTVVGYIESIDTEHGHMHIYDCDSRHFVASVQRFSRERVGDFVRFIPVIPQTSKFKTAIIVTSIPSTSEDVAMILREIRITSIDREKGYASWELADKEHPIIERLSPIQLSQGETSPSFTNGYLSLNADGSPQVSCNFSAKSLTRGQSFRALVYLKRGKDRQKRPRVAKLYLTIK